MTKAVSYTHLDVYKRQVLNVDPTLEKFPAMKWCMDKNKDGISGWYMPALNELRDLSLIHI